MSKEIKILDGMITFEVAADAAVDADVVAALEEQLQASGLCPVKPSPIKKGTANTSPVQSCPPEPDPVPFAVLQFACGDCCLEAVGLEFRAKRFCDNEVIFAASDIITRAFHNGRLIETQLSSTKTVVNRDNFCLLAVDTTDLDPCAPLNTGVSPFAVRVACGACCIKVLNVCRVESIAASGVTLLIPPAGQLLLIKTINNGNLISVRSAKCAFVDTGSICSRDQKVLDACTEPQLASGGACPCPCPCPQA